MYQPHMETTHANYVTCFCGEVLDTSCKVGFLFIMFAFLMYTISVMSICVFVCVRVLCLCVFCVHMCCVCMHVLAYVHVVLVF